jgi:hypothetical protein
MSEYKLKDLSSLTLSPNEKLEVEVEGIQDAKVLLLNHAGKVHALSPRCTHYGAPLKNGVVSPDGHLTCPWHGGMSPLIICAYSKRHKNETLILYSMLPNLNWRCRRRSSSGRT